MYEVSEEEFNRYRKVQFEGLYNMFDVRARKDARLTEFAYVACMDQYGKLEEKYGEYPE